MAAVVYPAFVTGARESGYTAKFPDLADVVVRAPSQAELMVAAREALHRRLEQMTADGHDWPEPSEISGLSGHPDAIGAGTLLVDVDVEDAPVRVNISIGERLLKRIDQASEARGMTRSGFIAAASRQALGEGPAFRWDSKKVEETLADYGRTLNDKFGPESDFYKGVSEMERKITKTAEAFAMQVADAFRSKPAPPPPERKPAEEPPTPSSAG
ncbi:MAG TPA: type II toxin-antitoxin system HicB family antitoxin [Caulobacteraceae bacterium]|nr:type II toxin-antitoxin system HicB family antitoxin [Caulobacteraceae bacterium]